MTGRDRLLGWREQVGVPPAVGRFGCRLLEVGDGTTTLALPLTPELRGPDGRPSAAPAALLADIALTTSVVTTLPDGRAVTTISLALDLLAPLPDSGALIAVCSAAPFTGGVPQAASGQVTDDAGRVVARLYGWLLPVEVPPREGARRQGLVQEEQARDLLDLLRLDGDVLPARDALSNVSGTLHGGVGALATVLAAERLLDPAQRVLSAGVVYERPVPRDTRVHLAGRLLRAGRRTSTAEGTLRTDDDRVAVRTTVVAAVTGAGGVSGR